MSIAVPVIILVLLSAQVYRVLPNSDTEQKDKSEQTDKSSPEDKSGQAAESSSKKNKSEKADGAGGGGARLSRPAPRPAE
jgi:hypothetical protein